MDIHDKYKYTIEIDLVDDKSITVSYPGNIFTNQDERVDFISISSDGFSVENPYKSDKVHCEQFERRILIMDYICKEAESLNIDKGLIRNLEMIKSLIRPDTEEEREKEQEMLLSMIEDLQ